MKKVYVLVVMLLLSSKLFATNFMIDDSHTHVGFSIKHMMISNVKGEFKSYEAELKFDVNKKVFTAFKANIETTSIDTGIEKRDNHLRSADFFNVEKYPEITFIMTKYSAGKMYGNLNIHGVTKEIILDTTVNGVIQFDGDTRVGFTLEGAIKRSDFDLKWNKALELGGLMVGDDVKLLIEVEAIEDEDED
ncbi:MAG: polyisoprenoid-binding protein [Helicobacteraceae bacterium]|nr:polyisoprenoid-binding protein [Helicobacteraceae bacterium]